MKYLLLFYLVGYLTNVVYFLTIFQPLCWKFQVENHHEDDSAWNFAYSYVVSNVLTLGKTAWLSLAWPMEFIQMVQGKA